MKINEDVYDLFKSGDHTMCQSTIIKFVQKWVEKAIDDTKGMYTDTEYLIGESKEEFLKKNGFTE